MFDQLVLVGSLRHLIAQCLMRPHLFVDPVPDEQGGLKPTQVGGQVPDGSAVKITKDMDLDIASRHVIMVEDIVDTGMTLNYMLNYLKARGPASLAVCTLLDKRVRRIVDAPLDYIGFEVPDEFVLGYGLDYSEEYCNLPFRGIIGESEPTSSQATL